MIQKFAPLSVATEQGGSIGVLLGPPRQIIVSKLKQAGLLPQSCGGATTQLKTDLVIQLVTHAGNLAGWFAVVNATASLTDSPSTVEPKQLRDLHIELKVKPPAPAPPKVT
jgi:hypothetical protein